MTTLTTQFKLAVAANEIATYIQNNYKVGGSANHEMISKSILTHPILVEMESRIILLKDSEDRREKDSYKLDALEQERDQLKSQLEGFKDTLDLNRQERDELKQCITELEKAVKIGIDTLESCNSPLNCKAYINLLKEAISPITKP